MAGFVDAATRLNGARFLECVGNPDDQEIRSRILMEECDVLRELKLRGGLDRLLPRMDDPNEVIRTQAATACLALGTEKAIATLETAAKNERFLLDKIDALQALESWRAGKPVIWGVV